MDDFYIEGDNPLTVYHKPPSLQNLSRIAVALVLWRRRIARGIKDWNGVEIDVEELAPLPKQLRELVEESVASLRFYAYSWSDTLKQEVITNTNRWVSRSELTSEFFDDLVVRADGSIDEYATAKVLVMSDKLDVKTKYKLACSYCLEDVVKRLWPLLDDSFANEQHENTSLLYYWQRRMRNEISAEHRYDEDSPENIILRYCKNWAAVEYLWNCVHPHDRAQEAIFIFKYKSYYFVDAVNLLSKLNDVELDAVISEVPCEIANCLGYGEIWTEFAFRTWKYMCRRLTADQLVEVLWRFIGYSYTGVDMTIFISEAWLVSPEHFRNYVRQNRVKELVDAFANQCFRNTYPVDVRFIIDLLSGNEVEMNAQIWRYTWSRLPYLMPLCNYRKIMQLCFRNEGEIVEFKKSVMNDERIGLYCDHLMAHGRYHDLVAYLNFFTYDKTAIDDLVKSILKDTNPRYLFCPDGKWCIKGPNLSTFLDLFFDDYQVSRKVKLSYVLSSEVMECLKDFVLYGIYQDVMYIVDEFASSANAHRNFIKTSLLEHRLTNFTDGFGRLPSLRKFKTFFIWCDLPSFKGKLPIDNVLRLLLVRIRETHDFDHYDEGLEEVDDFLLWYFETDEKVRAYKSVKIYAYEESKLLSKCLCMNDGCVVDKLLAWFFDDDSGKIDEFKDEMRRKGELLERTDVEEVLDLSRLFSIEFT